MKKVFLLVFMLTSIAHFSQSKTVIQDFGQTFTVENPDLLLNKDKVYKIIFDVYTDSKDTKKVNPLINTVARFINIHTQTGVPLENLKIVVVLHGKATKDVLNTEEFLAKYKADNPNSKLLAELNKANVNTYVCGQSYAYNKFKEEHLDENVQMALSALTVLVAYQSQGYQLITFN